MNEKLNLHLRHKPRYTVAQRRAILGWAIKAVCGIILGVLAWLRWGR